MNIMRLQKSMIIFLLLIYILRMGSVDLGEKYDVLMGKYTNPYFNKCLLNDNDEPWISNSRDAYLLTRHFFEKNSIFSSNWKKSKLKIPKIIHQIWLGGKVPKKYAAWIESWDHYNPKWTHIIWTDEDIKYLKLYNQRLFNKAKNYGEKSDILRLELLNIYGGLYVDTDYECLKPFDDFHYCHSLYVGSVGVGKCGIGLINALIGSSPKHPIIELLVESMPEYAHNTILSDRTGPKYMTKIFFDYITRYSKDICVYPPLIIASDIEESYAHHWFDASWLTPKGLSKKIEKDRTLENALTPGYIESKKLISDTQSRSLENIDCLECLKNLQKKNIVELGTTEFLFEEAKQEIHFIGISPVKFLVIDQRLKYMHNESKCYWWKDWLYDQLPSCGLLVAGNCMEYLSFKQCKMFLINIRKTKPEFLIASHDPLALNKDTSLGVPRALNLCAPPFNFPEPHVFSLHGKSYGLWQVYDYDARN